MGDFDIDELKLRVDDLEKRLDQKIIATGELFKDIARLIGGLDKRLIDLDTHVKTVEAQLSRLVDKDQRLH